MRWSPQVIYCNACGERMEQPLCQVMGTRYRVCSRECLREMEWRDTLSLLGKPYYPKPEPEKEGE